MNDVNFLEIIKIYNEEVKPHTRNKRKIYLFEKNKMQNFVNIYKTLSLINKHYFCRYNIFLIYEPKCRVIMSLNTNDKIINHYIARKILVEKLDKYLIINNVATRKNMGNDYGRKLLNKYIELNKKYDKFYILKLDISKYFYSIDHDVLKMLLKELLSMEDFFTISKIIDTTNYEYINETINKYACKKDITLPLYYPHKGLPIGNMTSQFLAIFYLYKLDFAIVHKLGIPCYVRYMDDFILIHPSKEKLVEALKYIQNELENTYKLKLNVNKTMITDSKEGFSFLGYHYRIENKKTIRTLTKCAKNKIKKRIKSVSYYYRQNKLTFEKSFCSMASYRNNYKTGNKMYVNNLVERYWFDEFKK